MLFIKKTKDFHEIFDNKKKISGNLFSVYYRTYEWGNKLKVGIIVKKKFGNAVQRNKFKRRIRAYFYENKSLWNKPLGLIIIANSYLKNIGWNDIKNELDISISKILSYENIK